MCPQIMTMNQMMIRKAYRFIYPTKGTESDLIAGSLPGIQIMAGRSRVVFRLYTVSKLLLLFVLVSFSGISKAQELLSIKNGQTFNPEKVDSFLRILQSQNDYVISFRVKLSDEVEEKSDYFLMLMKDSTFSAYRYQAKSKNFEELNLTDEALHLVWDTFMQNDLFNIQDESEIPVFCLEKYRVYNSYTYEFVLLSKDKMKKLSYYDPEYYDNACYGMIERKKVINSVAVIAHVLSNSLVTKP